jgi:hypothetical protein
MLHCFEQAIGQVAVLRVVVDREGIAARFLAQLHQEGRQVVTLLRADQYQAEESFAQVGEWKPWRYNRSGQVISEVAAARFALKRLDDADPAVEVEVALIRDWRKLQPVEEADERDWQADLPEHQRSFWADGWQAMPALPVRVTPKLLPVITTGHGMEAEELAQTYFRRWSCQENALRDWLIPLHLDTNHGYAKEQVVNSELVKRQFMAQGSEPRLQRLAQSCRARLTDLGEQDQELQEQVHAYEQRWSELSLQLMLFEATGQSEEREYFPLKARQAATEWEVRQRKARLEKHAMQSLRILNKCEGYCRVLKVNYHRTMLRIRSADQNPFLITESL